MKKILVAASMMLLGSSGAWAIGTLASTSIDNYATLSYDAGGVSQPDVNSSTDTFVVDKKIDMILVTTDTDQLDVTPGQQDRITNYEFRNEGNADQNFSFSVKNLTTADPVNGEADYNAEVDTKQVDNLEFSCDGGTTWYAAAHVFSVDHDANLTCQVRADIKGAGDVVDGDVMNVELSATAYQDDTTAESETSGADSKTGAPDVVFADGEAVANGSTTADLGNTGGSKGDSSGNGIDVARSGYKIKTPILSATKTSCVVNDPVNNTTNPKRIPGATIRYRFDIVNSGTGVATDVNLTDILSANFVDGTNVAISNALIDVNKNSACPTTTTCTSADSGSVATHSESGMTTTIQGIDINNTTSGNNHTCVSFEVEIK